MPNKRRVIHEDRNIKTKTFYLFWWNSRKEIPENVEWIDDAFYIKKTRFGLFTSILKDPLGQHFITGATEQGVITMTRWHLMQVQEGTLNEHTRVVNDGIVGGKL